MPLKLGQQCLLLARTRWNTWIKERRPQEAIPSMSTRHTLAGKKIFSLLLSALLMASALGCGEQGLAFRQDLCCFHGLLGKLVTESKNQATLHSFWNK